MVILTTLTSIVIRILYNCVATFARLLVLIAIVILILYNCLATFVRLLVKAALCEGDQILQRSLGYLFHSDFTFIFTK
jgi:hypothetical protein